MKVIISLFSVFFGLLLLSSCGGGEDGNGGDVKAALEDYLDKVPASISVSVNFPVSLADGDMKAKKLQPLVTAGLLEAEAKDVEAKGFAAINQKTVSGKKYSLTALGERLCCDVDKGSGGFGRSTKFRYASKKLESITSQTEPKDMNGSQTIHLEYTYRLADEVKELTEVAEVQTHFSRIKTSLSDVQTGSAVFVKTEKGWIHEKLMKQ